MNSKWQLHRDQLLLCMLHQLDSFYVVIFLNPLRPAWLISNKRRPWCMRHIMVLLKYAIFYYAKHPITINMVNLRWYMEYRHTTLMWFKCLWKQKERWQPRMAKIFRVCVTRYGRNVRPNWNWSNIWKYHNISKNIFLRLCDFYLIATYVRILHNSSDFNCNRSSDVILW